MKKNKKASKESDNIYEIVITGLTALLFIALFIVLITIKIIPMKYIIFLMTSLLIVDTASLIMLWKKKKIWIKVVTIASSILKFLFLILIVIVYNKTNKTIDKLTNSEYEVTHYAVIARKEDSDDILDYNNKIMSVIENMDYIEQAVAKVEERVAVIVKESGSFAAIIEQLMVKDSELILIKESYLDILEEAQSDTINHIKIIYTFEIKNKIKDIKKEVDMTLKPFTILISGIDTYGPIGNVARSDVNILMTVNPKTYEILLVHIPRDYYIPFSNHGMKDKLTHTGVYGVEVTVSTLENYFGIDINYYIRINFNTLIKIVDILGGIEVNVDVTFSNLGETYTKGINNMDGKRALIFSRSRKMLYGGDRDRGRNQQKVLTALINKASSPKIIANYSSVLEIMGESFTTNMSSEEIKNFINFELNKLPKWNIKSISVDGSGIEPIGTPFFPDTAVYMMEPDIKTVKTAIKEINKLKNKK